MTGLRAQDDPEALAALARDALASGNELAVEPLVAAGRRKHAADARLLHWHALLLRALDRREEAIEALTAARRLAPADGVIAHGLAHVSLEAGLPSAALFETAIRLAPSKPEIRLGLASARFAEGQGERGLSELDAMLAANAGWYEGHRQYAQLAAMLGHPEVILATIERALRSYPKAGALYLLAIEMLFEAERFAEARALVDRAIAILGEAEPLLLHRAAVLDELGLSDVAAALFDRLGTAGSQAHAIRLIRHRLRRGEAQRASSVIEPWLTQDGVEQVWPYAALIWRLTGDARADWLEEQPGTIAIVDLPPEEIGLTDLAGMLRGLHGRSGRFLNQSVRHGTQTDGPLFARIEPPIVSVRERLRQEIVDFAARLPEADSAHPVLGQRRDRWPRFAGSWSVRLTGAGFHESHFHPQGWLSAVLYVAVPPVLGAGEGRLVLGEAPANLRIPVGPMATVEPRPGRLVIFPSTMLHATTPFSAGERMTVAFDIARP